MGIRSIVGVASLIALVATSPGRGPPDPADLVRADLVAETQSVAPATTLWVDLRLAIRSGWHVYWRNPGDSGLPTAIEWQLPSGYSAGAIRWPVPERFVLGGIGNYGYAGSADLLVPISVPRDLGAGRTVSLSAQASWLVCADICMPGGAKLALNLPVAAGPVAPDPAAAAVFAAARGKLPTPANFTTRFISGGDGYRLLIPESAIAGLRAPTGAFFPSDGLLMDHAAEARSFRRADGLEIVLKKAPSEALAPANLDGVLVLRDEGGGERAFDISAERASGLPADNGLAWWEALLLAFLGGVILNAMPCVFPILSLKLLSLAGQAYGHRSEQLGHGLAYAAGVLVSFTVLGGALLALRAGGRSIGWGFQLQQPAFVALIAYLLLAMGLSLSGVVSFGAGFAGTGGRLAGRT